jgi:hypothetical protein
MSIMPVSEHFLLNTAEQLLYIYSFGIASRHLYHAGSVRCTGGELREVLEQREILRVEHDVLDSRRSRHHRSTIYLWDDRP